jgi:uncharacterized membrane protein YtjA (UPF0391 family)
MLRLAMVFLVLAILVAGLGFYGVAGIAWEGARIFAGVFLALAVLSFLAGYGRTQRA